MEEMRDSAVTRTLRADSELPNVVGEVAFFLGIPQPRSWQVLGTHGSLLGHISDVNRRAVCQASCVPSEWP